MRTPYSVVYNAFFAKIKDSIFLIMEEDERDIELLSLLNQSIPLFLYPKVDLDDKDDIAKEFAAKLTNAEVQILSEIMKLQWIGQKINDEDLLRQQFSDHDFKLTSQAAHLNSLIDLEEKTEKRIKKMQNNYAKVNDREPDFSGLAGR